MLVKIWWKFDENFGLELSNFLQQKNLRKRNRQTQLQIAKENCLQNFDPSGFRKAKIGHPINGMHIQYGLH